MLSRRSGQDNNRRRRRRTHRLPRVHQHNPVLRASHRQVLRDNRARRRNPVLKLQAPLVNHLPACRQAHRECHRPAQRVLLRQFRELLSLPR